MSERWLVALPVFNEVKHVDRVLDEVRRYCRGRAGGRRRLDRRHGRVLARRGATSASSRTRKTAATAAALLTAFDYAQDARFDMLVTIDCDGQHEPQRIPRFVAACRADVDIVSGSRYLRAVRRRHAAARSSAAGSTSSHRRAQPPAGPRLTDAFCGFKATASSAPQQLHITETGYAMPLELWVQAAAAGLRIIELPVPLIYLDEKRSFGGVLDDGDVAWSTTTSRSTGPSPPPKPRAWPATR